VLSYGSKRIRMEHTSYMDYFMVLFSYFLSFWSSAMSVLIEIPYKQKSVNQIL